MSTSSEYIFRSPRECWESSAENRRRFIVKAKCNDLAKYHVKGCENFDNWVRRLAIDPDMAQRFFIYYEIVCPMEFARFAPYRMALAHEVDALARCDFRKIDTWDIVDRKLGPVPAIHNKWPKLVDVQKHFTTRRQAVIMQKSVEKCILRRQEFRKRCVIACSKKIKGVAKHDQFLLILQIIRAKLIMLLRHSTF